MIASGKIPLKAVICERGQENHIYCVKDHPHVSSWQVHFRIELNPKLTRRSKGNAIGYSGILATKRYIYSTYFI